MDNPYGRLAEHWDEFFPLDQDRIRFLSGFLSPGSRVLELGCGTGTTARALAERGCRVKAVDPDEDMIRIAKSHAADLGALECALADMLGAMKKAEHESCDAVLCLGNTLPHLKSAQELSAFFRQSARILVPGGFLVIQILNYSRIRRLGSVDLEELRSQDIVFRRRHRFDEKAQQAFFETELSWAGGSESAVFPLYPATRKDLLRAASTAFHLILSTTDWVAGVDMDQAPWFALVLRRKLDLPKNEDQGAAHE